jgi:hypothetical protein
MLHHSAPATALFQNIISTTWGFALVAASAFRCPAQTAGSNISTTYHVLTKALMLLLCCCLVAGIWKSCCA